MTPDFQRRIQRYGWDRSARAYERCWREQLQPAQRRLLDVAALQPEEAVCDVACGTGLVTLPAADAVAPDGTVVGVDLSAGMIEGARKAAADRGIRNVRFERMDAEALTLPGGQFDAALCSLGLMYVPDPVQALKEMYRVLAPGGRAAAVVWGLRRYCGWAGVFPIVDAHVASEVCPLFFQLGTGDGLAAAFRAAGFDSVSTGRFSTALHYETGEDACRATFEAGAVVLAYRRFDDATREAVHTAYLASIAPYHNGSGYDVPGEFVVARGRRPH